MRGAARLWPGIIALVLCGAAPALPLPPQPPPDPPTDQAAPTPRADARGPINTTEQGPEVTLRDFRRQWHDGSQGFTPGSHYQTSEDRKSIQTPGVLVRVPLQ
jgi:hypothetical protein